MLSIMTRPKGSGQLIGNSRACAPLEERWLLSVVDLANEFDIRIGLQQRLDAGLKILTIRNVDLSGDLQLDADATGDTDRGLDALLRRDPAQEREVILFNRLRSQQLFWNSVKNRFDPAEIGQRQTLVIGDRHHRNVREKVIDLGELGKVETAVQRRKERGRLTAEQRGRESSRCENAVRRTRARGDGPAPSCACTYAIQSFIVGSRRKARGQTASSLAEVTESPLANRVTS